MAVLNPSRAILGLRNGAYQKTRQSFSTISRLQDPKQSSSRVNVEELLSKPSWSITSLLLPSDPQKDSAATATTITSQELHHLLRLSALPPPGSSDEEARLLSTLSSQLHFVQEIQKVDTTDVEPLTSLRDETKDGERESEIGLEKLREALGREEIVGKWYQRVRRKKVTTGEGQRGDSEGNWDVLSAAGRKVGRYFVVEGGPKG